MPRLKSKCPPEECKALPELPTLSPDWQSLRRWFLREKRELPWREDPTPYKVWVSEVMLQQTQASVVGPYFERWLQRFPSITALAEAAPEEVIKEWEGLGYYSRARNLHQGARFVRDHHGGELPQSERELQAIKGLGPYTVGAIRSFAFRQKAAAIDGNVLRVMTRYFAIQEDIAKGRTVQLIRKMVQENLPDEEPWVISEALIELGALICARKPKCGACPLNKSCRAFLEGAAETLPIKSGKMKTEQLYRGVAVLEHNGKLLIRQGKEGEIMQGLHEFPYCEMQGASASAEELGRWIAKALGLESAPVAPLKIVTHSFTKYRATLMPWYFAANRKVEIEGYQWLSPAELEQAAFSAGHRRIWQEVRAFDSLRRA